MKVLWPLEQRYSNFVADYLRPYSGGYKPKMVMELCFSFFNLGVSPNDVPGYAEFNTFSIYHNNHYLVIKLTTDFVSDGSTYSIDYDCRMLFALAHDAACIASQESKTAIYERIFDNVAAKMIMMQSSPWMKWYNWFIAWRTEIAVRAWDSF